jgi:YD repeat-containing protein
MKNPIFFLAITLALFLPTPAQAVSATVAYTYDALGRVTKATYSTGTTITYTYDAAGNRTAQTVTCPATGC